MLVSIAGMHHTTNERRGSGRQMRDETQQVDGHGSNLAAISRRVVALMKEQYGKGPTGARTYHSGDLVVVLMTGGFTTVERTLIENGRADAVSTQRRAFQETVRPQMRQIVEEEMRLPVIAFMSANHHDPDLSAELFVLASKRDGEDEDVAGVPAVAVAQESDRTDQRAEPGTPNAARW